MLSDNSVKIVIPGVPIPKTRPRFSRGRVYNDQAKMMSDLSFIMKAQCHLREPYSGPVSMEAIFFMPIPKSLSLRKQKELEGKPHIKKADIDNILKYFLDSIVAAGNIITDDAIICQVHASKIYSSNPRTEIVLAIH